MALAHFMSPNHDDAAVKVEDIDTIRECFAQLDLTPEIRRRVLGIAGRYTRRVGDDGIRTESEPHEIENALRKILDV